MNGRGEPEKVKKELGPFAGSGKTAVSPGLGAYLRPGTTEESAANAPSPAPVAIAKPSAALLALSLWMADAFLLVLSGCLLWKGGASHATLLLTAVAVMLAAWCGSLACWIAFSGRNE